MNYQNVNEIEAREMVPGMKARFVHSDKMTFAFWDISADSALPEHSHPHEQFSFMVQGRLRLRVGEREKLVGPGDIWHVPPNVVHGGDILGDEPVIFVDVFHPIREEVIEEMRRNKARRLAGGFASWASSHQGDSLHSVSTCNPM